MKNKQKKFTFKKIFSQTFLKSTFPAAGFFTWEDWFRWKMMKQGYLIQDVRLQETITISCVAAKANISLAEREKLQKTI